MIGTIMILLLLLLSLFFTIRNYCVFKFRRHIADRYIFNHTNGWEGRREIHLRVSYAKMLYSFKPLKLESFFSAEEIKMITKAGERIG